MLLESLNPIPCYRHGQGDSEHQNGPPVSPRPDDAKAYPTRTTAILAPTNVDAEIRLQAVFFTGGHDLSPHGHGQGMVSARIKDRPARRRTWPMIDSAGLGKAKPLSDEVDSHVTNPPVNLPEGL